MLAKHILNGGRLQITIVNNRKPICQLCGHLNNIQSGKPVEQECSAILIRAEEVRNTTNVNAETVFQANPECCLKQLIPKAALNHDEDGAAHAGYLRVGLR